MSLLAPRPVPSLPLSLFLPLLTYSLLPLPYHIPSTVIPIMQAAQNRQREPSSGGNGQEAQAEAAREQVTVDERERVMGGFQLQEHVDRAVAAVRRSGSALNLVRIR